MAQEICISGMQERGIDRNAVLESKEILLPKTMYLSKVLGTNNGFWIKQNDKTIYVAWTKMDNDSCIGLELKKGKYQAFPNLLPDLDTASVQLYFLPKKIVK